MTNGKIKIKIKMKTKTIIFVHCNEIYNIVLYETILENFHSVIMNHI